MKKVYNYAFQLVCVYILVLSIFSIFNIRYEVDKNSASIINNNKEKMLESTVLIQNSDETDESLLIPIEEISENKEETTIEQKIEEVKEEPKEEVIEVPQPVQQPQNIIDTSSFPVLASENVNISHYGPDCQGCGNGETAAGYNVSGGRITYEDPTFGTLRIVAADAKYPLGTVIRLSQGDFNINAIVLDRGGGIGDGKKYQIDLLIESEAACANYNVYYGANLEVLRYGY